MNVPRRSTPRTPLGELLLLQREVNQLFERLAHVDQPERQNAGEWQPPADVYECDGKLTVVMEVPGLGPEGLRVAYHDRCLVVSGERRERKPTAGPGAYLCLERPQGRFKRTIPLDIAVDLRAAQAKLQGGLLIVTLPRLKDRRGRETSIPVEREER